MSQDCQDSQDPLDQMEPGVRTATEALQDLQDTTECRDLEENSETLDRLVDQENLGPKETQDPQELQEYPPATPTHHGTLLHSPRDQTPSSETRRPLRQPPSMTS